MTEKAFRKSLAVFPIGTVLKLTGLTARQVRHYEAFGLITPKRSETNRRLYSLNDVDRLLEITDLIKEGMTLKGIERQFKGEATRTFTKAALTDQDVRRILWDELDIQGRFH